MSESVGPEEESAYEGEVFEGFEGGTQAESSTGYVDFDGSMVSASGSMVLLGREVQEMVSTVKPLCESISRYIYTGRSTGCDIMCCTNTSKATAVPVVKDPTTAVTLPYTKKFSFASLGKGETPWQKLKFDEARISRNNALKMERDAFVERLHADRRALEEIEAEEKTLLAAAPGSGGGGGDCDIDVNADPDASTKGKNESRNYALFVRHSLRPVVSRKLTLSKEEERRMMREIGELQDELCSLAAKMSLKPIRGLTLEPRGKASRRKRQVENAAARRLQKWCKMLAAKRLAKQRCQIFRDEKRSQAAKTIQVMFKKIGTKSFLKNCEAGRKNDAAKVIQCAGRKFLAVHRVRVLKRQSKRSRLVKHANTVLHRSMKAKLKSLEPRNTMVAKATSLIEEVLAEEMIADGVSTAQIDGQEEAFATLASMGVLFAFLEDFLYDAVPEEYERVLMDREIARLKAIEDERIAAEVELIKKAQEHAALLQAEEDARLQAIADEEAKQALFKAERKRLEAEKKAAEREEMATKVREEVERKAQEALAVDRAAALFEQEQRDFEKKLWEEKKAEREREIRQELVATEAAAATANAAAAEEEKIEAISQQQRALEQAVASQKAASPFLPRSPTVAQPPPIQVVNVPDPVNPPTDEVAAKEVVPAPSPNLSLAISAIEGILNDALRRASPLKPLPAVEENAPLQLPAVVATPTSPLQSVSEKPELPLSQTPPAAAQVSLDVPSPQSLAESTVSQLLSLSVSVSSPTAPATTAAIPTLDPTTPVAAAAITEPMATHVSSTRPEPATDTEVRKVVPVTTAPPSTPSTEQLLRDAREGVHNGRYPGAQSILTALLSQVGDLPLGTEADKLGSDVMLINGMCLYSLGRFAEAKEQYERALETRLALYGSLHFATAEARMFFGILQTRMGDYGNAHSLLAAAVGVYRPFFQAISDMGEEEAMMHVPGAEETVNRSLFGQALIALGEVQHCLGQWGDSEKTLQEAAVIVYEVDNHLLLAEQMYAEAALCIVKGSYARATTLLNQVLEIRADFWQTGHPLVARVFFKLARVATIKGDCSQALSLVEEGFTVLGKTGVGDDHPLSAFGLYARAKALQALGQYDRARDAAKQCLQVRIAVFGQGHLSTTRAQMCLADITTTRGFPLEAKEILVGTSGGGGAELGGGPRMQAEWLHCMALNAEALGDVLGAQRLGEEACEKYNEFVAEFSSTTNKDFICSELECCRMVLARANMANGGEKEARKLLTHCGKNLCVVLGTSHVKVADSIHALGVCCTIRGKYKDATQLLQKALKMKKRLLGDDHPEIAAVFCSLAENYRCPGLYDKAMTVVEEARRLSDKFYAENSLVVALATLSHANLLRDLDVLDEATTLYKSALGILLPTVGQISGHTARALAEWAECARLYNKAELAAESFKKALKIMAQVWGGGGGSGSDHVVLADVLRGQALVLLDKDQRVEAAELLEKQVLPRQLAALGEDHPSYIFSAALLGLCTNNQPAVDHALDVFDVYEQGAFNEKHPWVVELGGFQENIANDLLGGGSVGSSISFASSVAEGDA